MKTEAQSTNHLFLIWIGLSGLIATIYLFHGFSNLLTGDNLPVDLALRFWQSKELIGDKVNIYANSAHAQYPPSFYFFLYPVLHVLPYQLTDISWLILNSVLLISSSFILYDLSNSSKTEFRILLPLLFLTFHAIPHGLGVGQVHIVISTCFLISIYLAESTSSIWAKSFLSIVFLSIALGKFSLSIPLSIVLFMDKKHRINVVVAALLNGIISIFLLNRVNSSVIEYVEFVSKNSGAVASLGHLDVQQLIFSLQLPSQFSLVLSFILLSILLITLFKKSLSIWDKLALAALTARFFLYHAHYDNTILIFVLIALFQKLPSNTITKTQFIPLFLFSVSMIIPARFLEWNSLIGSLLLLFQLFIWVYSGLLLYKSTDEPILASNNTL